MFAKLLLALEVENDEKLSYNKAVVLQSIIMECINPEYAEYLHESGLHSYSQCLISEREELQWIICVTDKRAYDEIIVPLLNDSFTEFESEHYNLRFKILNKNLHTIEISQFMKKYYFEDSERDFNIIFKTPTAFKQMGKYVFYPDIALIYQSLMNKYDAISSDVSVKSPEVLEQLVNDSNIIKYNLKSCIYNIGIARIPAFVGGITIKVNGAQAMVNFVNMLLRFGEYSGVGIKTAMGMGKIEVLERRTNDRR